MQKSAMLSLIREEATRALVFGFAFVIIVSLSFTGVAYAANGGVFGNLLNQILASGNWESPGDATVKNAAKFGNKNPTDFVQTSGAFTCPANQCIYKIGNGGVPECR